MKIKIAILILLVCNDLLSQESGILRGKIIDNETAEPLFAANIGIKGTSIGTTSDFDGNFELKIPFSKTTLFISYIGYQTIEIENIEINFDKINLLDNIRLSSNTISLESVNISAQATRNTEAAILTIKKKSPVLMDAISAQSLKKSGDSNAAGAIKRVSGISISNGKYVYVRGLGDRYTKTQLNTMDLPGLDPDRNAVQIDIFPTNIIDNIIVYKSFSANLPADFTGGVVDIQTKAFPENKLLKFSASVGYNPNSNFNNEFLTYNGGKYDPLGIDDGTRSLPIEQNLQITQVDRINNFDNLIKWSNAFSNELSAIRSMNLVNTGISVSGGNQLNINDKKIGFIGSFSFKNNYDYFSENQQWFYISFIFALALFLASGAYVSRERQREENAFNDWEAQFRWLTEEAKLTARDLQLIQNYQNQWVGTSLVLARLIRHPHGIPVDGGYLGEINASTPSQA